MERKPKVAEKITVCEKNMCTGCMACVDICPKDAVKVVDSLDAYNAVIDETLCINCNACHKICQNNREDIEFKNTISSYQGWVNNEEFRANSSSGGFGTELIRSFVGKNGIGCSCVFKNGEFIFDFAYKEDDCKSFTGSKYVKSNPKGIYKVIKKELISGRRVLFVGLPCQVSALKIYVGKKLEDNLYTVDLICHGSPSPSMIQKFFDESGLSLNECETVAFRKNNFYHVYADGKGIEKEPIFDMYTHTFLNFIDFTENCYVCKYAQKQRVGDITIGDSWGSSLPEEEQKKGISLALCQTTKGEELLKASNLKLFDVDYENAVENNKQLNHPSSIPIEREKFFRLIKSNNKFKLTAAKCFPQLAVKQGIKKILIHLHAIN